MKFTIQLLITAVVCFVLQRFFPWWSMPIGTAVVSYFIGNKNGISFLAGLLAISFLWLAVALYIDAATHSILTYKVNKLLPVNAFVLTAIIGGLIGGLGALIGSMLRKLS
ncbi:MAG: hypothetical protein ACKO13_05060 [Cytophagales bacterium]